MPEARPNRRRASAPLVRLAALDEDTLRAWSLLVTCSAVILFLNTRPSFSITQHASWRYVIAQMGHLVSHVVLGALAWSALTRSFGHRAGYCLAYGGAAVHAVLDEWAQVFVPTRDANLEDVLTNIAGVSLGIAAMELLRWRAGRTTLRHSRRRGEAREASAGSAPRRAARAAASHPVDDR